MFRKVDYKKLIFILMLGGFAYAQPSLIKMGNKVRQRTATGQDSGVIFKSIMGIKSQASIQFSKEKKIEKNNIISWLDTMLSLRTGSDVLTTTGKVTRSYGNMEVERFQQYFKGIKVEHGIAAVTSDINNAKSVQLEFYSIPDSFVTRPVLNEATALSKAIQYVGAKKYIWENYRGNNPDYMLPTGSLTIVEDLRTPGKMCLCYKFNIYATNPLSRSWVYVDARDGRLILNDPIIKHESGQGRSGYSGIQTVESTLQGGKYVLQHIQDGHKIITKNYLHKLAGIDDASAIDFTSNTANWLTGGFSAGGNDKVAIDAHFNMMKVSEYWKTRHGRKSWDDKDGDLISYVHVNDPDNGSAWSQAFWNGTAMYYGDGNGTTRSPFATLDVSGHEMAHAICETTAGLVYRRESGAINEGLSDIWGECIDSLVLVADNSAQTRGNKVLWLHGNEYMINDHTKGRNMGNPHSSTDPAPEKYKEENFWIPTEPTECPVPDYQTNDYCGVHTNSSVISRWFYILVNGLPPLVNAIPMEKAEHMLYLTEQNLTPNSGYYTLKHASINAANALYTQIGDPSVEEAVHNTWQQLGLEDDFFDNVYNMDNSPDLATNDFTAINVGKDGVVWAGTLGLGLYQYNGLTWNRTTVLPNYEINQIAVDKNEGIWIAQSGHEDLKCTGGGINYFPTGDVASNVFYSASSGLPSRHSRGIFVLKDPDPSLSKIWVASSSNINTILDQNGNPATVQEGGGLGYGLNASSPFFTTTVEDLIPLNANPKIYALKCIGGNNKEIWAFTDLNNLPMIARYDVSTHHSIVPYYFSTDEGGVFPPGFKVTAIHGDKYGDMWVGLETGGVFHFSKGTWTSINFPSLFPAGSKVNQNAITSDKYGNVYIGTNMGLVCYFTYGSLNVNDLSSYRRYTKLTGFPSDNIKALAVDTYASSLWLATDNGIMKLEQLCKLHDGDCESNIGLEATASSTVNGNWSSPATWSTNSIPDSTTEVVINHQIMVDQDAICNTVRVRPQGELRVKTGNKLTVLFNRKEVIQTNGRKKKQ